jgi:hypothetical protein
MRSAAVRQIAFVVGVLVVGASTPAVRAQETAKNTAEIGTSPKYIY